MKNNNALIIFIKNPELGKVKTRLAATVGNERALEIYLALLKHTRNIALALSVDRHLYYSSFIDEKDEWNPSHFYKHLQATGDLGSKMANAFEATLKKYNKALIIGSDCATLSPEIVSEAYVELDNHDVVIGPASDGGYYLLGMKKFHPTLFADITWSTDAVLSTTQERLTKLNATYHLLPELSDIDYEEDWEKFGWDI